jgi:hypothetical protein
MSLRLVVPSCFSVLLLLGACSVRDPLYCDESQPCTDPARSFCDLQGEYPASEGIRHTCIPDPGVDPGADAGPDTGRDAAPDPDAAMPICTPSAFVQCTDDDTALYCSEDGFEYLTVDCGSECSPKQGGCFCEPSTSTCADNQAVHCNADGQVEEVDTCALGCNEAGLRCVDVAPSNDLAPYLDMANDAPVVALSNGATIDTDAGTFEDGNGALVEVPEFQLPALPGGVAVRVFVVKSLTLGDTLVTGTRALALVSDGDIIVGGHVRIQAGTMLTSDCIGGVGEAVDCGAGCDIYAGGGGGGFGSDGGRGGTVGIDFDMGVFGGVRGVRRGNATLTPLRGGCGGGGAGDQPLGGAGGGGVQLVSRTLIRVEDGAGEGHLNAGGRGGSGMKGGGSGGGILLEAPRVVVSSGTSIVANGGGGGAGECGSEAEEGSLDQTPAAGGGAGCESSMFAGTGGSGAARGGTATNGEELHTFVLVTFKAGGGGGGVGRIRVNVPVSTDFVANGILSPAPTVGVLVTR